MLVTFSCDDVLLKDITSKSVILLSPVDGISAQSTNNMLIWESMAGASKYHIRIYSPSKSNPQLILKDTVITKTQFEVSFVKGDYEWCVKAFNEAYTTAFTCNKLTVN
jgi:hypothetical protein